MLLGRSLRTPLSFFTLLIIFALTCLDPVSAANNMVVDGTPGTSQISPGGTTSGSISTSMTTTRSNDILIAYVGWESGGRSTANSQSSSVASTAGTPTLTWNLRTRYQNGGDQTQEIWWAVAPTAGTYGVQVNWSSQSVDDASLILFAINGANTTTPWEGSAATKLPLGSLSGNYSTTYANNFILTFYANEKATQVTNPIPSGVNTAIANVINNGATWWEYLFVAGAAVSNVVTSQSWGWSGTSGSGGTTFAAVIIDSLHDVNYVEINSVSFTVNQLVSFRANTSITATIPSSPGKVTFYANAKPITGCKNRKVSGSNSVTCSWKPTVHGQNSIFVSFISDGGQQLVSQTSFTTVSSRVSTR